MRWRSLLAAAFVAIAACALPGSIPARANGVPQLVKLTYLDGVSNFGPRDAEGVLEFSFAEAYARVDAKNLQPQPGYVYEGWMTGPGGRTQYVGELAVNASGIGSLETKLANLTSYDFNLFVVTGRDSTTAGGAMPEKRSIAGRFAIIGATEGSLPADTRPSTLPNTGEPRATGKFAPATLGLYALAIGLGLAVLASRISRRGHPHD